LNAPAPRRVFLSSLVDRSLARSQLASHLRREIAGEVYFDAFHRARYATDASIYQITPVGVVIPQTEDDLRTIVDIAREHQTPLLGRGAGTSQCGQTVGAALVVDCSKYLRKVIQIDPVGQRAEVQPGITLDALNAQLKAHGLWFAVDVSTSAQATLGGMAGNNSCGSRSLAYGNMVHNVRGIDAILADGTQQFFGEFDRGDGRAAEMRIGSQRVRELVTTLYTIGNAAQASMQAIWPRVLRRVGGYNLDIFAQQAPISERPYWANFGAPGCLNFAQLLVGSEGTLALTRRLHLHLSPLPKARVLGVVNFPSFQRAMECTREIVRLGPSAVELVDRTMIDLALANPSFRGVIERALLGPATDAILLVEFAGESRDVQLAGLARLVTCMGDLGLPGCVVEMPDETAQKALWEVRKAGLNIMMSMKGDGKPVSFIEDCAVPLEHLAEYTAALTECFQRHGTQGTWYAHASVGTLHVRPILDLRSGDQVKMRAIAEEASALVRRFKGAFSGEHGDGLVRSEWVSWQFGAELTRAFEAIKDAFDPTGLLNPGKIVRASRMDDVTLFRYPPPKLLAASDGADRAVAELAPLQALRVPTGFDWSAWNVASDPSVARDRLHEEAARRGGSVDGTVVLGPPGSGKDTSGGFARALEMCNNNGHCRKFDSGLMCPSYRVTRDEEHLTRGRANTLRQALSGALGPEAMTADAMASTMALCVSCKGCRRECPTGVDMAKMKIEFRRQWIDRHGLALRERLIAWLPHSAAWLARYPALGWSARQLMRLRNRSTWLRRGLESALGLSAARSLPVPQTAFSRQAKRGPAPVDRVPGQAQMPAIILWVDTFNEHFDPAILEAARKVLLHLGCSVEIAKPAQESRPLCCGRTFLAAGLVDQARAEAARTLRTLAPALQQGAWVVGLEPSCLLTLRDEFLVHRWDSEPDGVQLKTLAQQLADRALLFEEWLVRHVQPTALDLKPLAQRHALVHGHCHQKAFGAFEAVLDVLRWIPQLEVEAIQSACCGMAGAFGYEREHVGVSQAMAELDLLPAVRNAPADALIIADGTSCRHQIADGSGRRAEHVAQVLARALRPR